MKKYDVCILGSGAGGSLCTIKLAKKGLSVCVVDKAEIPAKKLLATGNGRCNLTNKNMSSEFYDKDIDFYLNQYNFFDAINDFKGMGLETYFDEEGRCYPISNTAKSVVFVISKQFENLGIDFFGNETIVDVCKNQNEYLIKTENNEFLCKNVVFATGNNQDMLNIAKKFVSDVEEFVPSLVALKTKETTKKMSGIRLENVCLTAKIGEKYFKQNGEVLFKDAGISGICIFDLSLQFAKSNFCGTISIDILPNYTEKDLVKILFKNLKIFKNAGDFLQGLLPKEVCFEILNRIKIVKETSTSKITNNQINQIAKTIKNFDFEIIGYYDNNQICSGGVKLENLTKNLQSKTCSGAYFIGEICNVSGVCGGYNLQWAFLGADIVAKSIDIKK